MEDVESFEPHWGLFRPDRSGKLVVSRPTTVVVLAGCRPCQRDDLDCVACQTGDVLRISTSCWNPGPPVSADRYFDVLMADGQSRVFVTQLPPAPVTTKICAPSDPGCFQPFAREAPLPRGFDGPLVSPLPYVFSGAEAEGVYAVSTSVVVPGTLDALATSSRPLDFRRTQP